MPTVMTKGSSFASRHEFEQAASAEPPEQVADQDDDEDEQEDQTNAVAQAQAG